MVSRLIKIISASPLININMYLHTVDCSALEIIARYFKD